MINLYWICNLQKRELTYTQSFEEWFIFYLIFNFYFIKKNPTYTQLALKSTNIPLAHLCRLHIAIQSLWSSDFDQVMIEKEKQKMCFLIFFF